MINELGRLLTAPHVDPARVITVAAATRHTLKLIARQWQLLNADIQSPEVLLAQLNGQLLPQLVAATAQSEGSRRRHSALDHFSAVDYETAWHR